MTVDDVTTVAQLDHDRRRRRGYPEAVYAETKTCDQLRLIARELNVRHEGPLAVLFTRVDEVRARVLLEELLDARHEPTLATHWG